LKDNRLKSFQKDQSDSNRFHAAIEASIKKSLVSWSVKPGFDDTVLKNPANLPLTKQNLLSCKESKIVPRMNV